MREAIQRLRPWLIGAAAFTFTLLPEAAFASSITTVLDGQELSFPIPPVVENGRTLVPARKLLESLGGTVGWEQESRTVTGTLGDKVVKVVIGSGEALVNSQPVTLDVPARVEEGHTLIPLRFFVENLGLAVGWNDETRTIIIDSRRTADPVSRDGATVRRTLGPAAVEEARKLVGLPYSWGGISPKAGFDCSGFIYYVTGLFDLAMPRTSQEQFDVGTPVEIADLQAGDLVFFTTYAEGPSHVGIYDGNGSFIHAQSAETGVKVTPLSNPWWRTRYIGARRIFK